MLETIPVINELIGGVIMKAYTYALKGGIGRTAEFERKGLASFGVTCGIKRVFGRKNTRRTSVRCSQKYRRDD